MSTAKVYDITPATFRRTLGREQPAEGEQAASVLDDMADGVLALDFALTLAGFSYEARQLTLSIVGLIGGEGGRLEVFDKGLAEHVNCSDRTIRRWRAAHIKESKAKKFSLLHLEECDYNAALKRYEKTAYSFTAGDYVNTVVAEARASDLYQTDRRAAIERAAEEHYDEIPDAPPRARRRMWRVLMDGLLEQLDERIRRVVSEAQASRDERALPATGDVLDDETRRTIQEQALLAHKSYLSRKEVSKYLGVSERSIAEWSVRPVDQNPFPERNAGGEPRYKRTDIDGWAERERRRRTLKLA
jgi:hypothetical protein